MRKAVAYGAMAGIVLILAGADFLVLTSTASLSRLAARELELLSEGLIRWGGVRASLDGRVVLEDASLRAKADAAEPWLGAERVEILLRGGLAGPLQKVTLEGVRIVLSDGLIEDLSGKESERSIREIFPNAEDLPRIVCRQGTVETRFPAVLAEGRCRTSILQELALTPLTGYRAHVEGRFENPVFGAWEAEGEVDLDGGGWKAALRASGWEVGPPVRAALAQPDHRDIYDKFLPSGRCDLAVSMGRRPEKDLDFRATLFPRDMTLVYRNFPYLVEHIQGEIDFFLEGFRIKHAKGARGPATVRIDGEGDAYGREAGYSIRVEVDDLPLDGDVREALGEDQKGVWDLFAPAGFAQVRGRAYREPGPDRPSHLPLDFVLRDAAFTYEGFPYEVRGLSGEVSIEGNDVRIRRLLSEGEGTSLDLRGTIGNIVGDADIDLVIDARGLLLDDRLKRALPDSARKIWDLFSPSGPVDVRWAVRKEEGKEPEHRATARARGNSVLYREVPLPVSEVEGEIELEPGRVRLHHVKGKTQGAPVEVHGTVTDELASLRLDAVGLPLDDAVKDALPRKVGDLLRQMRLTGSVNFNSELKLRKDGEKKVELDLKIAQGVIDTEPRFEDLLGRVTLIGFFEKDPTFMGSLSFSQARAAGKRLTDVSASFNGKGSRINFSYIKAAAYGGLVSSPGFSIDTGTGDISGSFHVDRLDIREYALDTKGFSEKTLAGKASLELLDLEGCAADAGTITGRGRLLIKEGFLWDIPLFVSLFTLNPQDVFKAKNQFDAGAVDFEIRDRKFRIPKLAFTSESVSVVGRGRINFDGDMHLVLKAQSGRLLGIDVFFLNWVGDIFSFFAGAFMGVEVTGPFDNPVTSQKLFPGFK